MKPRRGFVLLAVIVMIGLAMLLAIAVTAAASAEHAGRRATFDAVRRRAAAWSAAQAITALVGQQRTAVLSGAAPRVRDQIILFDDDARTAVVRLLPASAEGDRLVAEAALVDVHDVDSARLAQLGLDDHTAALVESARGRAPAGRLASLEEIVDQEEASPLSLRGEEALDVETLAVLHGASGNEEGSALARAGRALRNAGSALHDAGARFRDGGATPRERGASRRSDGDATDKSTAGDISTAGDGGLDARREAVRDDASAGDSASVSTTGGADGRTRNRTGMKSIGGGVRDAVAADPDESKERSSEGSPRRDPTGPALADRLTVFSVEPSISRQGTRRAELGKAWTETLREALGAGVTDETIRRFEALASEHAVLEDDAMLVTALERLGVPHAAWGAILDRLTAEEGLWRRGRMDVNRASAEALATLPGLDAEKIARIEREREGLTGDERASPAWLVTRGIVEPAEFAALFPRVTARSFFWRVRFVAGFADVDDPDGPLDGATIWECVIDLTGERARLASLRDLSMAPLALRLMEERGRLQAAAERSDEAQESAALEAPKSGRRGGERAAPEAHEPRGAAADSEPIADGRASTTGDRASRASEDASTSSSSSSARAMAPAPDADDGPRTGDAVAAEVAGSEAAPSNGSKRGESFGPVGRFRLRAAAPRAKDGTSEILASPTRWEERVRPAPHEPKDDGLR